MALNALLYSGFAGMATLAGIFVVRWKQEFAIRYSHYINSFAAGTLITIALAQLIPKSVELVSNALLIVLARTRSDHGWTVARRIRCSLDLLCLILFVPYMLFWNLIGYRF